MQEQQIQIESLKKENDLLKTDNANLKAKVQEIDNLKVEIEQIKSLLRGSTKK